MLSGLVRKEVLGVQGDPRSPERGQYGFLQDLVRHVAYETLSKRERKTRHLAAAEHLEGAFAELDEVAEVLASHYLAAFEAAPDVEDAQAIRARAREMLARAGARAGSLGAPEEGRRYYQQAAALSGDALVEAELLEQAGRLAVQANRPAEAREQLERAISLYADAGESKAAARAGAALANAESEEGRLEQAATRLEQALTELEQGKPSEELAAALAQLGRIHVLAGRLDEATAPLERALTLAERLQLPEVFVEALISKSLMLLLRGRLAETRILLEAAVELAHAEQLYTSLFRAENNLAALLEASDLYAEALAVNERTLSLVRRRGDRRWESLLRTGGLVERAMLGRWDEALTIAAEEEPQIATEAVRGQLLAVARIYCERGELEPARALLTSAAALRDSEDPQLRAVHGAVEARLLRGEGRDGEALAAAERGLAVLRELGMQLDVKVSLVEGIEAALSLRDLDKADELLAIPEALDPGQLSPFLQASSTRLRARVDAARGSHDQVDERFRSAAARCREFGLMFHLAVTQLEHAEWLTAQNRSDEAQPLLSEARQTFEQLQATPWLARTAREPEAVIS